MQIKSYYADGNQLIILGKINNSCLISWPYSTEIIITVIIQFEDQDESKNYETFKCNTGLNTRVFDLWSKNTTLTVLY